MEASEERISAAGCLVSLVGAATGFMVWLHGARPGLHGAFESQRDWSLLYLDLPGMVIGVPAITLAAWTAANRALRGRAPNGTRGLLSGALAVVVLSASAWVCLAWLGARTEWVSPES